MSKRVAGPQPDNDERPRGRGAVRVAEMLPAIGGAAFRRFGFVQSAIVSRWGEIVGPRYAEVSAPESIRFPHGERANSVLTLTVAGAHAPMMQHVAPEIVERVNRFFGYAAVARLAMKQGTIAKARRRPPAPTPAPVPAEMGESVREIGDPELRRVLEALAQSVANADAAMPVIGKVG